MRRPEVVFVSSTYRNPLPNRSREPGSSWAMEYQTYGSSGLSASPPMDEPQNSIGQVIGWNKDDLDTRRPSIERK
jgi:hypothetical protein